MNVQNVNGRYLALAVLSFAAGRWMNEQEPPLPDAPRSVSTASHTLPAAQAATPSEQSGPSRPFIAVASDGNVTLRVEQQPVEWVLEEIARQSGWGDVQHWAGVARAPADCAPTSRANAEYATQLRQAIERGGEVDRETVLLQAQADGALLPDDLLRSLFETDTSEQVRLDAFELYLEPRSGDVNTLRRTLEAALYVPNDAVRQMAKQRLEELPGGEGHQP